MAISGIGAQFRRWNSTSGEWSQITEVTNITGPGLSRDMHDVTPLDPTDGYDEFISGLRHSGTVTLALNFSRSAYDTMKTDFESDSAQNYEIVLPDTGTTSLEFEGYVSEMPLTIPQEAVTFDVTIQITGKVEIESGSGPSANA